MFKHYICTRYNLGLYDKPGADEWMRHRWELFRRTLACIEKQTCQNFEWLVAFDKRTPDIPDIPATIIHETPRDYILKQSPTHKWLITTRLDNDDIVSPEWVHSIQRAFREKTEVIDFHGQLYRNGEVKSNGRRSASSMFISLIEPWDNPKTVFFTHHYDMINHFESRMLPGVLHWTVIHDKNLMNKW